MNCKSGVRALRVQNWAAPPSRNACVLLRDRAAQAGIEFPRLLGDVAGTAQKVQSCLRQSVNFMGGVCVNATDRPTPRPIGVEADRRHGCHIRPRTRGSGPDARCNFTRALNRSLPTRFFPAPQIRGQGRSCSCRSRRNTHPGFVPFSGAINQMAGLILRAIPTAARPAAICQGRYSETSTHRGCEQSGGIRPAFTSRFGCTSSHTLWQGKGPSSVCANTCSAAGWPSPATKRRARPPEPPDYRGLNRRAKGAAALARGGRAGDPHSWIGLAARAFTR